MPAVRILSRLGRCAGLVLLLAGCAQPTLVDDQLSAGGQPTTEFSVRDDSVTLMVRFDEQLGAGEILAIRLSHKEGLFRLSKITSLVLQSTGPNVALDQSAKRRLAITRSIFL